MLSLTNLFNVESLAPNGSRLLRRQGLPGFHVVVNAATGLASRSVPIALAPFLQRHQDPLFPRAVELSVVLRGLSRLVAIWTPGNPITGWKA